MEDKSNNTLFLLAISGYIAIVLCFLLCFSFMYKTTDRALTAVETVVTETVEAVETRVDITPPRVPSAEEIYSNMVKMCVNKESEKIASSVRKASVKYGVPVDIIYTVLFVETSSRTGEFSGRVKIDAKSSASCRGLMQLSKDAVNEYIWKTNSKHSYNEIVNNIDLSIDAGTWYFAERYRNWDYIKNKDWEHFYLLYNFGPTNFKEWTLAGEPDSIKFSNYKHTTDVIGLKTRYRYFDSQVKQRLYRM